MTLTRGCPLAAVTAAASSAICWPLAQTLVTLSVFEDSTVCRDGTRAFARLRVTFMSFGSPVMP